MVVSLDKYRKTRNLELSVTFGERSSIARKNQGMTQEEVAMGMCCDRSVVSKWECGKLPIHPEDVVKLAKTLRAPDLMKHYCSECPVCKAAVQMQPKPAA
ncbi:MAG: helix-turn-helix domain-containing protein [Desulfuromonadaceae bacterium]